MPLPVYMAMTEAEFRGCSELPEYSGWMACHFSPYGKGLSNIPEILPPDSLLIVNDRTPPQGHDPDYIAAQLLEAVDKLSVFGVLMDFQRPDQQEISDIAHAIGKALPCPVIVTHHYANACQGPVLLPPLPPNKSLTEHLAPWKGKELWLELSLEGIALTLTENGCKAESCEHSPIPCPLQDEALHCHYGIALQEKSAMFYLHRTDEDILRLLEQAETMGVKAAVGLYQELAACSICPQRRIDSDRPQYKEAGYGKHLS